MAFEETIEAQKGVDVKPINLGGRFGLRFLECNAKLDMTGMSLPDLVTLEKEHLGYDGICVE